MATPTPTCWQHELWNRLRTRWLLKFMGVSIAITVFMCVYFALLRHPQFAVTVMPLVALDRLIPFTPWAVVPYASLWLYIGLVPGLLYPRGEMVRYGLAALVVAVIGCGVFFFFPTVVPVPPIDWARWPMLAALKSTDAAGNACPSLHVAYSVLSVIWMGWLLRRVGAPRWLHGINIVWCLLIVWSTVAIRQHVVLDVEAGALLGGAVALIALVAWPAWSRRRVARRVPC
ncbi:MAG TPA: phosphatase PAP2 family protein [Rhodanobacteraceae bacterium]